MYAYIDGKLAFKSPSYVVIDAGGVGYHINISLNTYSLIGTAEHCKLYTWLHVKEDGHSLYGFADEGERRLFLAFNFYFRHRPKHRADDAYRPLPRQRYRQPLSAAMFR